MFWKKYKSTGSGDKMRLTELKSGQTAIVKEIDGGYEAVERLATLGIRPGKTITKISSHFWKGPIAIRMDKAKVAIGHGMAEKIIVELS